MSSLPSVISDPLSLMEIVPSNCDPYVNSNCDLPGEIRLIHLMECTAGPRLDAIACRLAGGKLVENGSTRIIGAIFYTGLPDAQTRCVYSGESDAHQLLGFYPSRNGTHAIELMSWASQLGAATSFDAGQIIAGSRSISCDFSVSVPFIITRLVCQSLLEMVSSVNMTD